MMRKSIIIGIIVGLLLALAGLYPAFAFFVTGSLGNNAPWSLEHSLPFRFGWPINIAPLVLLMASTWVITLVSLALGSVAAWYTGAVTFKQGLLAGLMSGLVAGLTLHVVLVSPTATIWAGRDILNFHFSVEMDHYPDTMVVSFVRFNLLGPFSHLLPTLLACMAMGGLEGGLIGWLRRGSPQTCSQSLLEAIDQKDGRRTWFAVYQDQVLKIGLMVGLVGGLILVVFGLSVFSPSTGATPDDIWVASILRQAMAGTPMYRLASSILVSIASPVAFLVMIGAGGVAAALPKNPPNRLRTRIYVAAVAGGLIGALAAFPVVNHFYFGIALLPQFGPEYLDDHDISAVVKQWLMVLASAPGRALLLYFLPLFTVSSFMILGAGWGALQGLVYGFFLVPLKLRPVDRVRPLRREIIRRGNQFLPRLYWLFQTDHAPVRVLEHLAFELKDDPDRAHIAAAYHLLVTQPSQAVEALEVITQILDRQPTWQLQKEISALHRVIAQGLQAGTVAQMVAIAPLPEDETASLPPMLLHACKRLTSILTELKKVERVDDPGTKIIFLNNTLENMRQARLFVREGLNADDCGVCLPDFSVLRLLLDRWEAVVLSTVKEMQGRANLTAVLKARRLVFTPQVELSLKLLNSGLNVAEDVRLQIDSCQEGYEVVSGQEHTLGIISPQESREISFIIQPARVSRLRVCWQISYTDAFHPNQTQTLEFGDMIEFVQVEKPFQRIFPIPYVTGTPLQNGQMFVGRQDVFDFVREQLLGAYQNNIIVLHGQRRTGKTSILYRLSKVLTDTHVGVLIDMQGQAARGEADFLYAIADDIVYTLEQRNISVELPPRQDFFESPEFFFRSRFLRRVTQALGDKNLLLMFDEFEELQKRVEDGKLSADIFSYLRNLMQHEQGVDFVFAGTHKLEELAAKYWSILFNIAAYKKITFLSPEEVTRLVTAPVASFGLEYDPLAIERIYQVAAGQPYFTQMICHELVAYHNEAQRSYLTNLDVDAVLGRIIERGEAHFKYIWAESTLSQRLALLALAELLEVEIATTFDDVVALLHKRGRPLDKSELTQALDDLEDRDIIMRSGPRSNLYRFRIDLIRRWIYAARPAYEQVI